MLVYYFSHAYFIILVPFSHCPEQACQPISLLQLLIHSYVQYLANELTSKEPDIKRTKYFFPLENVK